MLDDISRDIQNRALVSLDQDIGEIGGNIVRSIKEDLRVAREAGTDLELDFFQVLFPEPITPSPPNGYTNKNWCITVCGTVEEVFQNI